MGAYITNESLINDRERSYGILASQLIPCSRRYFASYQKQLIDIDGSFSDNDAYKDFISDAIIRIANTLDLYPKKHIDNWVSYGCRIVNNLFLDLIRKKTTPKTVELKEAYDLSDDVLDYRGPEKTTDELRELLEPLLTEAEMKVIDYRYLKGCKTDSEVAGELSISSNTVGVTKKRALVKLKEALIGTDLFE